MALIQLVSELPEAHDTDFGWRYVMRDYSRVFDREVRDNELLSRDRRNANWTPRDLTPKVHSQRTIFKGEERMRAIGLKDLVNGWTGVCDPSNGSQVMRVYRDLDNRNGASGAPRPDGQVRYYALSYRHYSDGGVRKMAHGDFRAVCSALAGEGFTRINLWIDSKRPKSGDWSKAAWVREGVLPYCVMPVIAAPSVTRDSGESSYWSTIEWLCGIRGRGLVKVSGTVTVSVDWRRQYADALRLLAEDILLRRLPTTDRQYRGEPEMLWTRWLTHYYQDRLHPPGGYPRKEGWPLPNCPDMCRNGHAYVTKGMLLRLGRDGGCVSELGATTPCWVPGKRIIPGLSFGISRNDSARTFYVENLVAAQTGRYKLSVLDLNVVGELYRTGYKTVPVTEVEMDPYDDSHVLSTKTVSTDGRELVGRNWQNANKMAWK